MKNKFQKLTKDLRKNQTPWERKLWFILRNRFTGYKFRRQFPIDNYIVDFCCLEKRFIIEIDGSGHIEDKNIEKDKKRDKYLNQQGFKILRIWNNDIDYNLDGVYGKILEYLEK